MEKNLKLYSWYSALFHFYAFLPIFVLYLLTKLTLEEVLLIESLYYFSVVALEVPSGFFSDRFGRRLTLILSAIAKVLACILFLIGHDLFTLAIAQITMGFGFAFNSGSDTSLHYDSLSGVGKEHEFQDREAKIGQQALISSASSSLLGGALAVFGLHWAYVVSGVAWLGSLVVALFFKEPTLETKAQSSLFLQIKDCLKFLKTPLLLWVFAFSVTRVVLEHVPYTFYQPYLDLLRKDFHWSPSSTPLAAGVIAFVTQILASFGAKFSSRAAKKLGTGRLAVIVVALNTFLIGCMAVFLHPAIILLLFLRSIPRALVDAPIKATIAPKIPASHRATYFSLQSLAGRLSFSGTLLGLSWLAGDGSHTWPVLSNILLWCLCIGVTALLVLGSQLKIWFNAFESRGP